VYLEIQEIEDKKVLAESIFSAEFWKITQEEILSQSDVGKQIASMIEVVQNPVTFERVLNIHTIDLFIQHLQYKLPRVEAIILKKFYDSQTNTFVKKQYAKKLNEIILKYFKSNRIQHLTRALEVWGSKRLIAIGSIKQHEFLTYVIRQLIINGGTDKHTTNLMRDGIKLRLDGEADTIRQAHIIWDTFADSIGAGDNHMLPKEELEKFDNVADIDIIKKPVHIVKESVIPPTDEPDSDDESDFEGFEVEEDKGDDIQTVSKPLHLYDLFTGLQSDGIGRYHQALENATELIRKNLPNLDVLLYDIIQILFRIENKFGKEDFEVLKADAIRAWIFMKPAESSKIIFARMSYREASLGHKIKLLGLLQDAIRELADSEYQQEGFDTKAFIDNDFSAEFKNFFDIPKEQTGFDKAQEVINKRVEDKTIKKESFYSKQKEQKAKKNYLLAVADKILFPLLAIPIYSETYMVLLDEKDLAVTYLKTVSILLYYCMNAPNFQAYLEETCQVMPVFMQMQESAIRKALCEVFTTVILGTKQFMLRNMKPHLDKVSRFRYSLDFSVGVWGSRWWWRHDNNGDCQKTTECLHLSW